MGNLAGPIQGSCLKGENALYDLAKDPSETTNLAAKQPDKARELVQLHQTWHQAMMKSAKQEAQPGRQRKTDK